MAEAACGAPAARRSRRLTRLFPEGGASPWTERELAALGATMAIEGSANEQRLAVLNPGSRLFAGTTYLGQFIDHDLSHDTTRFQAPGAALQPLNHRTADLDLDSLYGAGPAVDAALYEPHDAARLRAGCGAGLPRTCPGLAAIADHRNDFHLIVNQIHAAFVRLHNGTVHALRRRLGRGVPVFELARQWVRWHYQWIVLNEFLPTVIGRERVEALLGGERPFEAGVASVRAAIAQRLRLFEPRHRYGIPVEFSGAAFRFGHSMVRADYQLREGGSMMQLFDTREPDLADADDLRGARDARPEQRIDWRLFFPDHDAAQPFHALQLARPIDVLLSSQLGVMPTLVAEDARPHARSLPFRNLVRGEHMLRLPSGQEVAAAMVERGLLAAGHVGDAAPSIYTSWFDAAGVACEGVDRRALVAKLRADTPLWYYVLWEAGELERGERLGPVGARIVGEVIVGLLLADRSSFLWADEGWRPVAGEMGCRADGRYSALELLQYADTIAPDGSPAA